MGTLNLQCLSSLTTWHLRHIQLLCLKPSYLHVRALWHTKNLLCLNVCIWNYLHVGALRQTAVTKQVSLDVPALLGTLSLRRLSVCTWMCLGKHIKIAAPKPSCLDVLLGTFTLLFHVHIQRTLPFGSLWHIQNAVPWRVCPDFLDVPALKHIEAGERFSLKSLSIDQNFYFGSHC